MIAPRTTTRRSRGRTRLGRIAGRCREPSGTLSGLRAHAASRSGSARRTYLRAHESGTYTARDFTGTGGLSFTITDSTQNGTFDSHQSKDTGGTGRSGSSTTVGADATSYTNSGTASDANFQKTVAGKPESDQLDDSSTTSGSIAAASYTLGSRTHPASGNQGGTDGFVSSSSSTDNFTYSVHDTTTSHDNGPETTTTGDNDNYDGTFMVYRSQHNTSSQHSSSGYGASVGDSGQIHDSEHSMRKDSGTYSGNDSTSTVDGQAQTPTHHETTNGKISSNSYSSTNSSSNNWGTSLSNEPTTGHTDHRQGQQLDGAGTYTISDGSVIGLAATVGGSTWNDNDAHSTPGPESSFTSSNSYSTSGANGFTTTGTTSDWTWTRFNSQHSETLPPGSSQPVVYDPGSVTTSGSTPADLAPPAMPVPVGGAGGLAAAVEGLPVGAGGIFATPGLPTAPPTLGAADTEVNSSLTNDTPDYTPPAETPVQAATEDAAVGATPAFGPATPQSKANALPDGQTTPAPQAGGDASGILAADTANGHGPGDITAAPSTAAMPVRAPENDSEAAASEAAAPSVLGGEGSVNLKHVSADLLKKMAGEGLAVESNDSSTYVVVDALGGHIVEMVFQRKQDTKEVPDPSDGPGFSISVPDGAPYYALVGKPKTLGGSLSEDAEANGEKIEQIVQRYRTSWNPDGNLADQAEAAIKADRDLQSHKFLTTAGTIALHMIPLGAAADGIVNGEGPRGERNWKEIGISLAGDGALLATLGASAFVTTTGRGVMAARAISVGAAGVELGIAGIRAADAKEAYQNGDKLAAAGYIGEAFLRLFGASSTIISEIKAARAARVAAPSNVEAVSGGRVWRWGNNPITEANAAEAYAVIRASKTDVAAIARNMGLNERSAARLEKIKQYLFNNPNFTPDPAIATAWQRMRTGTPGASFERDLALLKHEVAEMWIKAKNPGIGHMEAHRLANEISDWEHSIPWDELGVP